MTFKTLTLLLDQHSYICTCIFVFVDFIITYVFIL